jgi:hypothetical protein
MKKRGKVKSVRVKYPTTGSAAVKPSYSRRREQRRASASSTDAAELGHRNHDHHNNHNNHNGNDNKAQASDSPCGEE